MIPSLSFRCIDGGLRIRRLRVRATEVRDPSATRGLMAPHKPSGISGGGGGVPTSCSGIADDPAPGDGGCTADPGSASVGFSERDNRRSGSAGWGGRYPIAARSESVGGDSGRFTPKSVTKSSVVVGGEFDGPAFEGPVSDGPTFGGESGIVGRGGGRYPIVARSESVGGCSGRFTPKPVIKSTVVVGVNGPAFSCCTCSTWDSWAWPTPFGNSGLGNR